MNGSVNHAANLGVFENEELRILFGTRLSDMVITDMRRTLAANLFLDIDSDVDLCRSISYLCTDYSNSPSMSDTALDGTIKRQTLGTPSIKTFQGFCKGGFEVKLSVEQMECIQQNDVLRRWYNDQLMVAIENGKNAIMARFYRHLLTTAHPGNTGPNAGLTGGGQQAGTPMAPILFNPANADRAMTSLLEIIKQMPTSVNPMNEFGQSTENAFFFGPSSMEQVFMQTDDYNLYNNVGDCNNCQMFSDTFNRMPRGLMPITSYCVESRTCDNGGNPVTIYPVLFGKRYMGAKAAIRVKIHPYVTPDGESLLYRVTFYSHIHTFDPRYFGVAWITVASNQPETVTGC